MEPDAIRFLLDLQGTDLGRLQQEVEKAVLYAGSEKRITLIDGGGGVRVCRGPHAV